MNKIGIITFIRPCNYGAALQCYALNRVFSALGAQVVTVDYWPTYFKNRYYPKTVPLTWSMKGYKEWYHARVVRRIKERRNKKFEKFINNYVIKTSETTHNITELQEYALSSGIRKWITGSDQVWSDSCAAFDPAYFLDFALPSGSAKYSYAASFGMSEIREKLKNEYTRRLSGYRRYSVREQSGVSMIQELLNVEVNVHCDPTLLLTANEWEQVASSGNKGNYILIYHVKKADLLIKKAAELSRKTGLRVILFSPYFQYQNVDTCITRKNGYATAMESSPQDFISLIKNAKYVLTNSFHGTVFCALFHKEFWSQLQFLEGGSNNRSANLMKKLGLMHRVLEPGSDLQQSAINWEHSDSAIAEMREEALSYIKSILNDTL